MYKKRTCLQRSKASILTREGALCALEATNLTNCLGSATHSFVCEHCVWGWLGLVVVAAPCCSRKRASHRKPGSRVPPMSTPSWLPWMVDCCLEEESDYGSTQEERPKVDLI